MVKHPIILNKPRGLSSRRLRRLLRVKRAAQTRDDGALSIPLPKP